MDKEIKEKIALARYMLICPVLAEPERAQNAYFRAQALKTHHMPHYGKCEISVSTFKAWLRAYIQGLTPKERSDKGHPRKLSDLETQAIELTCKAFPNWTVRLLYDDLIKDDLLRTPPVSYNTVLRYIHRHHWLESAKRHDVRKRYEVPHVNELWICDFMHGPMIPVGNTHKKAILCAIIDDHSRMIVGHQFDIHETVKSLVTMLKESLFTYGLPKRFYVDNGPDFASDMLIKCCAQAGIALVHSKPYDAPSRGKIERFFRTVRERFISGLKTILSLDELNEAIDHWVTRDYHQTLHRGIETKPIDRYHASLQQVDIKRLSRAELDTIFLVRHERIVNNDATISFKNAIYEVPSAYIRKRIEIRHPIDDEADVALYDRNIRIATLNRVNVKENAHTFRPQSCPSPLSFANREVRP